MGLRDKAKKTLDEADEAAEGQASELDGLARAAGAPESAEAESLRHELERAREAARREAEERQRAETALREDIRKLSGQLGELRTELTDKEGEVDDLRLELAKERATAKQRAIESEHRIEVLQKDLEHTKAAVQARESEVLRMERDVAAAKGEATEARQVRESSERDLRGELQRAQSEAAANARKLEDATEEVESLRRQVAGLEKALEDRGRDLGAREQALRKREAEVEQG